MRGAPPPLYPSYDAKKEFAEHKQELPDLAESLMRRHDLSDFASKLCAQNMLRYKETHGENPSSEQTAKMAEIAKQLEHKDYNCLSHTRDEDKRAFLRQKEGDLLFRHGPSYDASRDLDLSKIPVDKLLKQIQHQQQIEQQKVHEKQMDLGL